MIETFLQAALHFDRYLNMFVQSYGIWTYLVLFLIVFAETGLVVTPFLPGDSLLFAVGALAAAGTLDVVWLMVILSVAGIIGDSVNYAIGKYFGDRVLGKALGKFIKKEHIEKTHSFYEKYGGKTIVIARFVPIVRTLAPFVAGIGKMSYLKFAIYNVCGGILWVCSLVAAGFYFGNIPVIKDSFSLVVLGIIFVSILPGIIEYLRYRFGKRRGIIEPAAQLKTEEKQGIVLEP
jgi:membrane-associated protein